MMNIKKRDRLIRELHFDKKWSYAKIGKDERVNLSSERVSQICNEKENKEEILLDIKYHYKKKFTDKVTLNGLLKDIQELSRPNRKKEVVERRRILVQFLYDELDLPF
jgi:hypothetical protein